MNIPAQCPSCSLIFPSGISVGSNSRGIVITDCKASCRRCGSTAKVIEGTFDILQGTIKMVQGPDFTREVLANLNETAQQVFSQKITAAEGAKHLKGVHKSAGDQFHKWATLGCNFVMAMAAVTTVVFLAREQGSNRAPIEVATQEFEKAMAEMEQISTSLPGPKPLYVRRLPASEPSASRQQGTRPPQEPKVETRRTQKPKPKSGALEQNNRHSRRAQEAKFRKTKK